MIVKIAKKLFPIVFALERKQPFCTCFSVNDFALKHETLLKCEYICSNISYMWSSVNNCTWPVEIWVTWNRYRSLFVLLNTRFEQGQGIQPQCPEFACSTTQSLPSRGQKQIMDTRVGLPFPWSHLMIDFFSTTV